MDGELKTLLHLEKIGYHLSPKQAKRLAELKKAQKDVKPPKAKRVIPTGYQENEHMGVGETPTIEPIPEKPKRKYTRKKKTNEVKNKEIGKIENLES